MTELNIERLPILADPNVLGGTLPDPGEGFTNRIVHPKNLEIEARREAARVLSTRELKHLNKELASIGKKLAAVHYDETMHRAKRTFAAYQDVCRELDQATDSDVIGVLQSEAAAYQRQMREMSLQVESVRPLAARRGAIHDQLRDHLYAIEREKLHHQLSLEMAKEAEHYATIIIERWSQLGYRHEYMEKGKRYLHKVGFSEIHVTPDAIWYKIKVNVKGFFGFKPALPYGVRVLKLTSDETLAELTTSCQRQVTATVTTNNGAWIVVHRLSSPDGILSHVTLEQLMKSFPWQDAHLLPIPVGVEQGRKISWVMLSEHPHMLIGGSTGNGKSNFSNAVVCCLLLTQSPDSVRVVFIDLKEGGAEFRDYEKVPHMLMPIVSTPEDAVNVLAQLDALRSERMKTIAKAGCKNILEYNRRYPEKKMYRVLIFVDEYARIAAAGKEFSSIADRAVGEIAALGRAAGVQLIAATQTPYARILPGETKANMACRVVFALPSAENSKSVLGNADAFKTLPQDIKGRAIVAVGSRHWQVQTPLTRDVDIDMALDKAMEWPAPEMVALPETVKLKRFDRQQLLDIVVNDLNGNLGAKPIFQYVKDSAMVTLAEVRELVKHITKNETEVEYEGVCYKVVRIGSGYHLKQRDESTKEQVSSDELSPELSP